MMEKMKMHSPNLTQENIARIREMFPACVTEAQGEDGKLRLAVDFDQLRQELSESIMEGPQERYHLNWPGKREALLTANAPIAKTLRPCREESVDFDTTKNLFIEGDNLEALKLLQETYLGKVKMIYIDPPYNTGNDFIYEDDFAENAEEFLKRSNQKDEEGNRLVTNSESNGRFHSDWLSMIYARLKLARNLLADDGVIFISIDDGEVGNLRKLADQIFGETNFIANLIWQKKYTRANDAKWFSDNHDHILCYGKDKQGMTLNMLPRNEDQLAAYSNPDNHPKGIWKATPLHAKSGTNTSEYTFNNGITWKPPIGTYRRFNDESMKRMDENNEIWFGADGTQTPSRKSFLCDVKEGVTPVTLWPYDEVGHNHEANNELKTLGIGGLFNNPKPTRLLKRALILATNPGDLVLDFFAGSSTTADAVMQLNAEDGGNRKFIMVQLPEPCDEKSEAFKAGYKTIAEISKERIRRAGKKILEGECHEGWNKDIGFRVLKIDSSNMADVYYTPDAIEQGQLKIFTDNIKSDRKPEDLLFQVLQDWGVDLSLPIRKETIQGKTIFFVNQPPYDLVACFDTGVNENLVKELARFEPLRVVFRDTGFVSDAVKINVEQIFKQMSPGTEVKSI
ncbi:site-specific DNA-methyltransferase [Nitratidesulfovibrio liaohensis]|uniref:site-specific DNA-methyltransferase n=1 Tax=Nitratidesulfovibrio liaohensis TaxID=2604158 RepID=UPI001AAFE018|nr:site-specific DNA-methyltransferase [Nitratidesulfovibrio liaohensis]